MIQRCSSCWMIVFVLSCTLPAADVASAQSREGDRSDVATSSKAGQADKSHNDSAGAASESTSPDAVGGETRHDRAALEREFAETLTGAVLVGVWQMTAGLKQQAPLSPPREERYEISRARKIGGDNWLIFARINFADKDVTIPVPVRVLWAGDTAVMTLDDVGLPMLGTYSARVTFHRGFYSGIWYSNDKDYGGVMMGRIEKKSDEQDSEQRSEESKSAPADAEK